MVYRIKEIENLLENFTLDVDLLNSEVQHAKRAFEQFGNSMTTALNHMNRYRWPGKQKGTQ